MAKRRDRGDNPDDILSELGSNEATSPFGGMSASDIADVAYGSGVGHDDPFAKLGRNREKIHLTEIDAITPNATQPRRAIPASVRQYWSGLSDEESMALFFQRWLDEINLERREASNQENFPIDAYLAGESTARVTGIDAVGSDNDEQLDQIDTKKVAPKERALMPVVELAASIRRDGLINPISIAQKGRLWEIETGERRWLAYHLLNWRLRGNEWQKIPARQVDGISIWRQATENNARADLNAIGKARQFALLLIDMLSEDKPFEDFADVDHEQTYYAQVADGNQYRVPYGMGEQLINAMGISDVGQLRHLRRLLRLPQIVWTIADDLDWSENFIRSNIIAPDETNTIRNAIRLALKDRFPENLLEDYLHLLQQEKPPKADKPKLKFADIQSKTLMKLEEQLFDLSKGEKIKAIDYLEYLLDELKSNT
ncbi:MAG: ParB/RepB/Spo0J family partition protein [Phototrophicaceae bacterium]